MSIHRSLVSRGKLARERNVWTRLERVLYLQKEGKWKEEDSVFGLVKVRTRLKAAVKKKPKKVAAEGALGAEGAAIPAATTAPAPAAKPISTAAAKVAAKEAATEKKKERGGKGAK